MGRAEALAGRASAHWFFVALALFASLFWVHYWLLHDVLGPLTVDELYFAHIFWMLREGLQQYSDFYSSHLPTYFALLGPLVAPGPPEDLSFVWALRASGVAAALVHAALLYSLCRRQFLFLLPLLMLFLVFGRMTEIRTDTAGLLLFNLGWWLLLRGPGRKTILIAAAVSALALLFSARAAVMMVGMGIACVWLASRRRDFASVAGLALLGAGFAAAVLLAYVASPDRFLLVVQSVYLDPTALMPDVPVWKRVLPLDRLLLVIMLVTALTAAVLQLRRDWTDDRALVIAIACATQILLVFVDPSPFQYVYGWAALPALAGIALLGRDSKRGLHAGLAIAAAGLAAMVLSAALAQRVATGGPSATASVLRISYDAPAASELRRSPTPRLLSMMVSMERQQLLTNQLAVLSEICRRIEEPALTFFYANPICLRDARYEWIGLKWPAMFEGQSGEQHKREFETLIEERPPQLVAWGKRHHTPELNSWGRSVLRDYVIHDGFALHRSAMQPVAPQDGQRSGSLPTAAQRPR